MYSYSYIDLFIQVKFEDYVWPVSSCFANSNEASSGSCFGKLCGWMNTCGLISTFISPVSKQSHHPEITNSAIQPPPGKTSHYGSI